MPVIPLLVFITLLPSPEDSTVGQEMGLVGPGSAAIRGRSLPRFTDSSDVFNLQGDVRRPIGMYVDHVETRSGADGRIQLVVVGRYQSLDGTDLAVDTIGVDAVGLRGREVATWLVQETRGDRATRLKWVEKATGRVLQTQDRPPAAASMAEGYWRVVR